MDDAYSPFFEVTATNHAGWLVIVTISFLVYSMMGVVAKIVSRFHLSAMQSYDWAVVLALVLAFAQSVLLTRSCRNGLGQPQAILSEAAVDLAIRDLYAATLLQLFVHTLSKISVVFFILALNSRFDIKVACYIIMGVVTTWGLCSVFIVAFRCHLPTPWTGEDAECLDAFGLSLGISLLNILSDIALVALPTYMMWGLQTSFDIKLRVVGLFGSRIVVPISIILQLVYWGDQTEDADLTWTIVNPSIWGQVAMNLSILTACVPSLKGVLDMFLSGASMFTVPGQYTSSSSHNRSGGHGTLPGTSSRLHAFKTGSQTDNGSGHLRSFDRSKGRSAQTDTIPQRSESQVSLRDDAIMRTVEYEVYPDAAKPRLNGKATGSDGVSQSSLHQEQRSARTTTGG